jgi:hypothetical protein
VEKGTRAVKMCKMNNLYQGSPLLTVVFVNILGSNYLSYYAKAIFKVHEKKDAIKMCFCHLCIRIFLLVKNVLQKYKQDFLLSQNTPLLLHRKEPQHLSLGHSRNQEA